MKQQQHVLGEKKETSQELCEQRIQQDEKKETSQELREQRTQQDPIV